MDPWLIVNSSKVATAIETVPKKVNYLADTLGLDLIQW